MGVQCKSADLACDRSGAGLTATLQSDPEPPQQGSIRKLWWAGAAAVPET